MNYVLVRTKLQAVIVLELLKMDVISRPFIFAPLYQFDLHEDSPSVRLLYDEIARQACCQKPMMQTVGLLRNSLQIAADALGCLFSGGTVFASVVNFYPLAIGLKLAPFVNFVSFDDGAANTQVCDNTYHSERPLAGSGVKRWIARLLFPQGAAKYVRRRIRAHYTIYPGSRNIVADNKLIPLTIDWLERITPADRAGIRLPIHSILVGSVYRELPQPRCEQLYEWAIGRAELYIPHPREKRRPHSGIQVLESESTAESIINYILGQSPGKLTLYHFNSSVASSFASHPGVNCIDLLGSLPEA